MQSFKKPKFLNNKLVNYQNKKEEAIFAFVNTSTFLPSVS